MVGTITRKELIVHLVSFRFWVGTLFTIILASAATWVAARDFEQRQQGYESRQGALQAELRKVTVFSYLQPVAIRPPQALSILAQGADARSGTAADINLFTFPVTASGRARGNEFLSWLRTVDLTTLVSALLGLLALLLMADSVVGERADGSLRLVLAHGGSRSSLWAGKFLGGLAAVCLPLTGCLMVGLVLLHRAAPQGIAALGWWRIAGLVLVYLAYLSLMIWLGLLISLTAPTAARALQIAAFVWVLAALVIPDEAVWTSARSWSGVDAQRRTAIEKQEDRAAKRLKQLEDLHQQLLGEFTAQSPASTDHHASGGIRYRHASAPFYERAMVYHRQEVTSGMALADQARTDYRLAAARWRLADSWGRAFASLSPSFLLNRVADSIAGTAAEDFGRFQAAGSDYRQTFGNYLGQKGALRSWRWFTDDDPECLHPWPMFLGYRPEQIRDVEEARQRFQRLTEGQVKAQIERDNKSPKRFLSLADLPRFTYRPAGVRESLWRVAPELSGLLIANLLTAWACRVRFQSLERN